MSHILLGKCNYQLVPNRLFYARRHLYRDLMFTTLIIMTGFKNLNLHGLYWSSIGLQLVFNRSLFVYNWSSIGFHLPPICLQSNFIGIQLAFIGLHYVYWSSFSRRCSSRLDLQMWFSSQGRPKYIIPLHDRPKCLIIIIYHLC